MTATFEITNHSRKILLKFLDNYSVEQLNKIPPGFNNNLIWNIAHIVVSQQMMVYRLSGLPMMVSDELVSKYKRGTRPEADASRKEIDEIKSLLFSTIEKTAKDFEDDIFTNYIEYTTELGFQLTDAKTAAEFNNYHEGLHIGVMMSIRKFI